MLHDFFTRHRTEILAHCKRKIVAQAPRHVSSGQIEDSLPEYLDEVIAALRANAGLGRETEPSPDDKSASAHGRQRLQLGFSLSGVVHDYGSLCEAITGAARKHRIEMTSREYQVLNHVLDVGIAQAVTEYADQRERDRDARFNQEMMQHFGFVAHEIRNALSSATFAFEAIRRGQVPVGGRTSEMLDRSLATLRGLVDRSLTQIRLGSRSTVEPERTRLTNLMREVEAAAAADANRYGVQIDYQVDASVDCYLDRQLVASAVGNLVQNAIKYTKPGTVVQVRARAFAERLTIEVEDRCGGDLPEEKALFAPFVRGKAGEGVGLGLAIARQAIVSHGGTLSVQTVPAAGCIFTVDLPAGCSPPGRQP
jgi:signal transduction histidine kinase